jgi:hypothetical protein
LQSVLTLQSIVGAMVGAGDDAVGAFDGDADNTGLVFVGAALPVSVGASPLAMLALVLVEGEMPPPSSTFCFFFVLSSSTPCFVAADFVALCEDEPDDDDPDDEPGGEPDDTDPSNGSGGVPEVVIRTVVPFATTCSVPEAVSFVTTLLLPTGSGTSAAFVAFVTTLLLPTGSGASAVFVALELGTLAVVVVETTSKLLDLLDLFTGTTVAELFTVPKTAEKGVTSPFLGGVVPLNGFDSLVTVVEISAEPVAIRSVSCVPFGANIAVKFELVSFELLGTVLRADFGGGSLTAASDLIVPDSAVEFASNSIGEPLCPSVTLDPEAELIAELPSFVLVPAAVSPTDAFGKALTASSCFEIIDLFAVMFVTAAFSCAAPRNFVVDLEEPSFTRASAEEEKELGSPRRSRLIGYIGIG